jgi:hypothetical protein
VPVSSPDPVSVTSTVAGPLLITTLEACGWWPWADTMSTYAPGPWLGTE